MTGVVPFFRPSLGAEEIAEVTATLTSGWVAPGPRAERFESLFAERVGAPAATATSSGTAALHLALLALGVGAGDEVITTALTCPATVNAIERTGARAVLVDVDPITLTIDPDRVGAAITHRTAVIVPVHYAGHPCRVDAVAAIAREHGLAVLDDGAHALGALHRGRPVGSLADLTAFSFQATKLITTGEGGMLVGRPDLVDRARTLANQGMTERGVVLPGLKLRMSDVNAGIGLRQLEKLPSFLTRRRQIADAYRAAFSDLRWLEAPEAVGDVLHAWHLFGIRVDHGADSFVAATRARGVETARQFRPVHLEPYYRRTRPAALPAAEREADRLVSIPLYPAMSEKDVAAVVTAVRRAAPTGRGGTTA